MVYGSPSTAASAQAGTAILIRRLPSSGASTVLYRAEGIDMGQDQGHLIVVSESFRKDVAEDARKARNLWKAARAPEQDEVIVLDYVYKIHRNGM